MVKVRKNQHRAALSLLLDHKSHRSSPFPDRLAKQSAPTSESHLASADANRVRNLRNISIDVSSQFDADQVALFQRNVGLGIARQRRKMAHNVRRRDAGRECNAWNQGKKWHGRNARDSKKKRRVGSLALFRPRYVLHQSPFISVTAHPSTICPCCKLSRPHR